MVRGLWQDVRFGARAMRRAPAHTAVTVAVLGLGLGATATLFAAVNGVLRRPLPFREPERLVWVGDVPGRQTTQRPPQTRASSSPANFMDWRASSRTFEGLAAFRPWGFVLGAPDGPERVLGARVTTNLFALLGVRPVRGRLLRPDDERAGARVVVVSEELWRRGFGADPALVGTTIRLDGEPHTVVGVARASLALPQAELWTPLVFAPYERDQRGNRVLSVVGRLGPGVSLAEAIADLRAVSATLAERHPEANAGWEVTVLPLREHLAGVARRPLSILFGATAVVFLVACANLAILSLARAAARRREMAVRAALGAGRWRVFRQLALESVLSALAGGAVGLLVAAAGTATLSRLGPEYLPRGGEIRVDASVIAFALLAALFAGLGLAAVTSRHAAARDLVSAMKSGADAPNRRGVSTGDVLVVVQVAAALVLLVAGGALIRSFVRAQRADLGFSTAGVLTMTVSLPGARYPEPARRAAFVAELLQRIGGLQGVRSAGAVGHLPLAAAAGAGGAAEPTADVVVEGTPLPTGTPATRARLTTATPGYFPTLGVRLLAGRALDERDRAGSVPVTVVDESFARLIAPSTEPRDAVGRRVRLGSTLGADSTWREVVGVVGGVRASSVTQPPEPTAYLPHAQVPWPTLSLVLRTRGEPERYARAVRAEVLAMDPEQPVYAVRSLEDVVDRALAARRLQTLLLGGFSAASLLLAMLGVYGVLALAVASRRRELGVRLALGAQRREVYALVLRRALARIGVGLALGWAGAIATARLLEGVVFEARPLDPAAAAAASALLALAGLAASFVPARRAAHADPLLSLRRE